MQPEKKRSGRSRLVAALCTPTSPSPAGDSAAGAAVPPRRANAPRAVVVAALCASVAGCAAIGGSREPGLETAGNAPAAAERLTFIPLPPPRASALAAATPRPEPAEPPPEVDLLTRLRAKLTLPVVDDKSVATELAWYAKNPEYLERVFTRAAPYLYHIVEEIEARGMPLDLALLPIVESAFDPFAYSHGRAAGLWQIIPGTGTRLGLTQNWWYDGRRDVLDSTRAALDYLEYLHEKFDGDWLLAVAGYNSGEGNVSRALKRAEANKKARDFFSIRAYLPAETRTYVPRLLAIRDLVASAEERGITLPAIENAPQITVVETGGQIDMALAAELAEMTVEELYSYNAGVNRWATDPEGPHRLVVPVANADTFTAALASLGDRERVQWTRHRIRNGETLGGIAQRYQTTVDVLRQVNGLRNNLIRAGDDLMIPHAVKSLTAYSLSADARAAAKQNVERNGERREHVVRSGETLWTISQRYGVGVRELASWNAMAPGDVLSVGRKLVVWTAPGSSAAGQTAAAVAASSLIPVSFDQERTQRVTYTVRRGDSLFSIARRFRVTVGEIVEWNGVSTEKYLQPGQRLVIHVDVTEQSS